MQRWRSRLSAFRQRHETLWQLGMFFLMGGITMVVDLGVFAVCNYGVFSGYADRPFRWWLIEYSVNNGGLCAFLSFAVSFALSQTVNFFIQRKATFGADNNPVISGVLYAVMVLGTYAFVLWLPTVVGAPIYALLGASTGAMALKLLSEFLSACIQFPINKWVIMRRRKK